MSLVSFWTEPNNKQIANLAERRTVTLPLPINLNFLSLDNYNVTVSHISGDLPAGLRLENDKLVGTPYEVVRDTEYTFVLRATQYGVNVDRTYKILITGPDDPIWLTAPGLLPVGSNQAFFIVDSIPLDFQLDAFDPDLIAGDELEFFLEAGELPPGIQLTPDGRLVGIVEPILALEKAASSGYYDSNNYSGYPYDFSIRPDNGYDSFFYDSVTFDKALPANPPKKLNRYYEFMIRISDGDGEAERTFQIYVVGDDFLAADNTIMQVANGLFTADITYIRAPIWITPANLGYKRANNFVTIFLDVIDPNPYTGVIQYQLLPNNPDNTPSVLPTGLQLDESNGEIAGTVPYQPAITLEFNFTVRARRFVLNSEEIEFRDKTFKLTLLGEIDSVLTWTTPSDLGNLDSNYISVLKISATSNIPNSYLLYTLENGSLPPGLRLNFDGEIIGFVRSYKTETLPGLTTFDSNQFRLDSNTTRIDREFKFTAKVRDNFGFSAITREFSITVTDPKNKFFSNVYMQPFLSEAKRLEYQGIVSNNNIIDYNFLYRPNDPAFGVQDTMRMLVYAGIETKTLDYYMSAMAVHHKKKKYKLGEIKTALAKTPGTNDVIYEVVYIEVIDPNENNNGKTRKKVNINTNNAITVDKSNYDISNDSREFINPTNLEVTTRQQGIQNYLFLPNFVVSTRESEYIVSLPVTVILRDGSEVSTGSVTVGSYDPFRFKPRFENTMKVSSTFNFADQTKENVKYISNIKNMRDQIRSIGETERNYLPLWMRSTQGASVAELGFVKAIPLCYCLPGTSGNIIAALNFNNIDFKQFLFEGDRFIINGTVGDSNEKYLLFHNYAHNI